MLFRGFLTEKKEWIYGLHMQRNVNGNIVDYIVPDDDRDLRVFLYNKKEYKVEPDSVGRYCETLDAYEGDVCTVNGQYGIIIWDNSPSHYGFFIKPITRDEKAEYIRINADGIQLAKKNLYQKEEIIKRFEKPVVKSTSTPHGTEYGKMLLEQKTLDPVNRERVRRTAYMNTLNHIIESDEDNFVAEDEYEGNHMEIVSLLPYLQMYIIELAEEQGVPHVTSDYNSFEIYSFNFKANKRYYNIATVLTDNTVTSISKYRKKPKGKLVYWRERKQ